MEPVRDIYGFTVEERHKETYKSFKPISQREEVARHVKWREFLIDIGHGAVSSAKPGADDDAVEAGLGAVKALAAQGESRVCSPFPHPYLSALPFSDHPSHPSLPYLAVRAAARGGARPASNEARQLNAMVRQGLPMSLRGRLWPIFLEASEAEGDEASSAQYRRYLTESERLAGLMAAEPETSAAAGPASSGSGDGGAHRLKESFGDWQRQLDKDLGRTFPEHPAMDAAGRATLRRVLSAYMVRNPDVGYCQGLNFVGGCMLLFMSEERAFWCTCRVVESLLPGYHTSDLQGLLTDQQCFKSVVATRLGTLAAHLDSVGVDVSVVAIQWFLCMFMNALPLETCLNVWDAVFFAGSAVPVFQVALALLELSIPELLRTDDAMDAFETLQDLAPRAFDGPSLVQVALGSFSDLNDAELQRLRRQHGGGTAVPPVQSGPPNTAAAPERGDGGSNDGGSGEEASPLADRLAGIRRGQSLVPRASRRSASEAHDFKSQTPRASPVDGGEATAAILPRPGRFASESALLTISAGNGDPPKGCGGWLNREQGALEGVSECLQSPTQVDWPNGEGDEGFATPTGVRHGRPSTPDDGAGEVAPGPSGSPKSSPAGSMGTVVEHRLVEDGGQGTWHQKEGLLVPCVEPDEEAMNAAAQPNVTVLDDDARQPSRSSPALRRSSSLGVIRPDVKPSALPCAVTVLDDVAAILGPAAKRPPLPLLTATSPNGAPMPELRADDESTPASGGNRFRPPLSGDDSFRMGRDDQLGRSMLDRSDQSSSSDARTSGGPHVLAGFRGAAGTPTQMVHVSSPVIARSEALASPDVPIRRMSLTQASVNSVAAAASLQPSACTILATEAEPGWSVADRSQGTRSSAVVPSPETAMAPETVHAGAPGPASTVVAATAAVTTTASALEEVDLLGLGNAVTAPLTSGMALPELPPLVPLSLSPPLRVTPHSDKDVTELERAVNTYRADRDANLARALAAEAEVKRLKAHLAAAAASAVGDNASRSAGSASTPDEIAARERMRADVLAERLEASNKVLEETERNLRERSESLARESMRLAKVQATAVALRAELDGLADLREQLDEAQRKNTELGMAASDAHIAAEESARAAEAALAREAEATRGLAALEAERYGSTVNGSLTCIGVRAQDDVVRMLRCKVTSLLEERKALTAALEARDAAKSGRGPRALPGSGLFRVEPR